MRDSRKLVTSLSITLGLLALNLVAFNTLLAHWGGARLDLTRDRQYSISPATRRLLTSLDEDVTVIGYFSKRTHPKLAPLVPQIEDLLAEYRALAHNHLKVEIIDPREDEQAEREASERFGVESTPFRLASKYEAGIVNAYFALVVRYGDQYVRYGFDDLIDVEQLPDGDVDVRLRNLEYDLTRAIKKAVFGFRNTAELFDRVESPVRFTAVITPASLPELFKNVPDAVRKAAQELEAKGKDKFSFVEVDPSRDAAEAQQVQQRYGAKPMTVGLFGGAPFYLYGFLETGGRTESLPLAGKDISAASVREAIEAALRRETPGFLKTVGISAPAPSIPPELMMQMRMQGQMPPQPPEEFQQVKRLLKNDYDVRDVDLAGSPVPSGIDTLLVLRPKNLDERAVYHLDQYLMRGGRIILCVGNHEAKLDQQGLEVNAVTTGLDDWLKHLGVDVEKTLVLDDRNEALPIPEIRNTPLGLMRTWAMRPYPYLVEVRDDGLVNREITARLQGMGIYWGNPIEVNKEKTKGLGVVEILKSSAHSWTSDDLSRVGQVDYTVPTEGTGPRLLAVALTGSFGSYFAGKNPPPEKSPGAGDAKDASEPPHEVPLETSPETRLAVVGNADFLSDFVARALGREEGGFFDENLAFTQNLIDWMNLDSDLIGIRSRAAGSRRLVRVGRTSEIAVETANYLVPALFLLGLAGYRFWRRRRTEPLVEAQPAPPAGAPRRAEG